MGRLTSVNNEYYDRYNGICPHCKKGLASYGRSFLGRGFSYLSHRVETCLHNKDYQQEFCSELKAKLLPKIPLLKGCYVSTNSDTLFTLKIHGVFNEKNFEIELVGEPHYIKYQADNFENNELEKTLKHLTTKMDYITPAQPTLPVISHPVVQVKGKVFDLLPPEFYGPK